MASNGVMDKDSGKVQNASAHIKSLIVMYIAVVESHVGASDCQPPALQRKGTVTERSSNGVMEESTGKV